MSAPRGRPRSLALISSAAQGAERRALHPIDEDINRIIAKVRAGVEHPFRMIKRQFGYIQTRYRV